MELPGKNVSEHFLINPFMEWFSFSHREIML